MAESACCSFDVAAALLGGGDLTAALPPLTLACDAAATDLPFTAVFDFDDAAPAAAGEPPDAALLVSGDEVKSTSPRRKALNRFTSLFCDLDATKASVGSRMVILGQHVLPRLDSID
jgi:hypothetical protein